MERVGDAAFGPEDRIGQLTMRNLDIADSRARLEQYAMQGIVGGATAELVGDLQSGEAAEITAGELETDLEAATDAANEARGVRPRHRLTGAARPSPFHGGGGGVILRRLTGGRN